MAKNTSMTLSDHFNGFIAGQIKSGISDYEYNAFMAELDSAINE